MTMLWEALQVTSWQLIITIGRQRGLGLDANLSKSELLTKVTPVLLDPVSLDQALVRLSAPTRQALLHLERAGGHCPARYLRQQHGQLRPMSQLVQRCRRLAAQSDLTAFAPLEQLCLLGLAFLDRKTDDLFIPLDMRERIAAKCSEWRVERSTHFANPLCEPSTPASPLASPSDLLCHDLTCLLALLQREQVALLSGRWLPPHFLKQWAEYCAVPPLTLQVRSELHAGEGSNRRRFLHYLAENAGFVSNQKLAAAGGRSFLSLTPAVWLWLQASRNERLQQVWQTWAAPQPELWRTYRLPGHEWLADPAPLLTAIDAELARWVEANSLPESPLPSTISPVILDPTEFARLLLVRRPRLLDLVPANLLDPTEALVRTIEQLLSGPLKWLRKDREVGGRFRGEDSIGDFFYSKFSLETDFRLETLDSTFTLTLADGLPSPPDLMTAIEVSEEVNRGGEDAERRGREAEGPRWASHRLTAPSFIRAIQRGWSAPALLDTLNQMVDRPLTGQEVALLRSWAEAAGRINIHPAVLLETTDPGVITRLASTRRGRALIRRTLSPRAVVVDPAQLDLLIRRLTEQEGVPPKGEGGNFSPFTQSNSPVSRSFIWLALRVYQELGRLIRLPVHLPQNLLDQVAGLSTPSDLAAAEIAAGRVLAELQQVVEGRAIFPPWPEGSLPLEESLPLIEAALATGQNLDIVYYTAGADRLTRRLVEPYRLEWQGGGAKRAGENDHNQPGIPYLVGFCHRAQAERVFRVDRIQSLELAPRSEEDGQFWGE